MRFIQIYALKTELDSHYEILILQDIAGAVSRQKSELLKVPNMGYDKVLFRARDSMNFSYGLVRAQQDNLCDL